MASKQGQHKDLIVSYNELAEIKVKAELEQKLLLEKALRSTNVDTLLKANLIYNQLQGNQQPAQNNYQERKSFLIDPYNLYENMGYKDKAFSVSYNTLRSMSHSPITKATIKTRVEQVTQFSEYQDDEQRFGWQIRNKKTKDKKKITDRDKRIIEYIATFISEGGNIGDNWNSDDFNDFLRKVTPDSLILDQMTFEIREDTMGRPVEYFATDAATYRLAKTYTYNNNIDENGRRLLYYPKFVQVFESQIANEFYPWELCFGIRNPSTNIYGNGYGRSELEDMVKIITWMLYGDQYNGKFFSQGAAPKGIIRLSGNVNDGRLAEFKQQWQAQIAGVQNAWKTPILEADKMEFMNLQMTNQDMQFSNWQEYLIKLHSALYTIDPSEIGFPMGGSSNSPQFEADRKYKLQFSQEKGLFPLLKFIQRKINKYLVNRINSDFEFFWTGIDQEDEVKALDNDIKKLSNFMGYKEIRKKWGLSEELAKDDMIFNGIYYQMKMTEQQANMMGMGNNNPEENPFDRDNRDNPFEKEGEDNPFNLKDLEDNPFDKENKKNPFEEGSDENPFAKSFNEYIDELIGQE